MDLTEYNFIDFGCSKGDSIKEALNNYGGKKGLGIDIDPNKVKQTTDAGFEAIIGDATEFYSNHPKCVEFVTMIHFLEHLPSINLAKKCIESACELATEFVYIRQPYFDADPYLFSQNLKFYWSNWSGHTNQMTSLQFHSILNPLYLNGKIHEFKIYGVRKVQNSLDSTIHSIASPIDQHHFKEEIHPKKVKVEFTFDTYKETLVVISLKSDVKINNLLDRYGADAKLLFES